MAIDLTDAGDGEDGLDAVRGMAAFMQRLSEELTPAIDLSNQIAGSEAMKALVQSATGLQSVAKIFAEQNKLLIDHLDRAISKKVVSKTIQIDWATEAASMNWPKLITFTGHAEAQLSAAHEALDDGRPEEAVDPLRAAALLLFCGLMGALFVASATPGTDTLRNQLHLGILALMAYLQRLDLRQ